jgi:hypothetical protein
VCRSAVMKRLGLAIALAGAIGCVDRERINAACAWTGDSPFALQLSNDDHQEHLAADADLVVDLAIRYADATAGRMASPNWVRQRDERRTKLAAIVAARHGIAVDDVSGAAGRRSLVFMGGVAVGTLTDRGRQSATDS